MFDGVEPTYQIYRASELGVPVYRVVSKCPPTADDFIAYVMAGRGFPVSLFFRATGISMYSKRKEAVKLARSGRMGDFIAELHIDDPDIYVCETNKKTGHLDVWAPPRVLLNFVVNCDDRGVAAA